MQNNYINLKEILRGGKVEFNSLDELSSSKNSKLSILYKMYSSKMYYIAYSILNNEEQAKDAVQDSFVKLHPYIRKVSEDDLDSLKVKRLVIMIIKSVAIDNYRKNKRESNIFIKDSDLTERIDSKASSIKTVEDRHLITQMLDNLPPKYREIIQYRNYYGLSYSEIASMLHISEDVASKRYQRAKKLVIKMMGDEKYE